VAAGPTGMQSACSHQPSSYRVEARADDSKLGQVNSYTLTGRTRQFPATRQDALDAGFDGFIPKPVAMDALLEMLAERLNPLVLGALPESRDLAQRPAALPLVLPPQTDLEVLYELAKVGDVVGIEKRVERLRVSGGYAVFTEHVAALAEGFEIQELQTFLSRWYGSSPAEVPGASAEF